MGILRNIWCKLAYSSSEEEYDRRLQIIDTFFNKYSSIDIYRDEELFYEFNEHIAWEESVGIENLSHKEVEEEMLEWWNGVSEPCWAIYNSLSQEIYKNYLYVEKRWDVKRLKQGEMLYYSQDDAHRHRSYGTVVVIDNKTKDEFVFDVTLFTDHTYSGSDDLSHFSDVYDKSFSLTLRRPTFFHHSEEKMLERVFASLVLKEAKALDVKQKKQQERGDRIKAIKRKYKDINDRKEMRQRYGVGW